ncbi:hypothetical protein ScPMuIL_000729 [Solemya velum]
MFGRSYTLKVTPVYVCTTGAHRKEIYEGRGSTILIVTEDSYEKDPVQRLHSDPSCKYNTSFEEERMRFIESTKDKRLELLKKQQRLQKNKVVTNQIKPKLACFFKDYKKLQVFRDYPPVMKVPSILQSDGETGIKSSSEETAVTEAESSTVELRSMGMSETNQANKRCTGIRDKNVNPWTWQARTIIKAQRHIRR